MKPIKFKQWLPIEGRHVDKTIKRPDEIAVKAAECMVKGQFHAQVNAGFVSLFFVDEADGVSHSMTLRNDKNVPAGVDCLVERVHKSLGEKEVNYA